jgi:glucokinase
VKVAGAGARLLADVGGTNARFAWQAGEGAPVGEVHTLPCDDHASLAAAIEHYLARVGRTAPAECAIAIANPVTGDEVAMTNHHWAFSISALRARFGFEQLRVLNDFTALALALPSLPADELRPVGGGASVAGTALALIGPGTGLGVSGLLPAGTGWVPLQGEGGHVTLAGCTAREQRVLAHLGEQYGHVSAERAVCGQGLADIHRILHAIDHPWQPQRPLGAPEVTRGALRDGDARCTEALGLFCAFLGTAAGNLALTLGAQGGVFIGGGIVPRLGTWFDASPFRERFEAKGRFRPYLAPIPVYVIESQRSPALLGAARALDMGFGQA